MQTYKPGSVSQHKAKISIINLLQALPHTSNDLPTNIGRAALRALAYLVFQLPGFTNLAITSKARELLPHVFTLSQLAPGGIFSVALSVVQVFNPKPLPVRKRDALRCPDFPPRCEIGAIEQFALAQR